MKKALKRSLSLLLAITIIFSSAYVGLSEVDFSGLFEVRAKAATSGTTGNCTWSLDGTVLTISGNGAMGDYTYSSLSPWGTDITKVIIKNGVTSIGDEAFDDCESLTSVSIGNSVTTIGLYAFGGCTSLTSITIPDSVMSIGHSAYAGCYNLKSVNIGNSVKSIGAWAFTNCAKLTSITIPESVTTIYEFAFKSCLNLKTINLPDSIINIGQGAVLHTAFYDDSSNWDKGVLYIGNHLLNTEYSITGNYAVKEGTKDIACGAFYSVGLTSITLPDSVVSIGSQAFDECRNLSSVILSSSITSIPSYAFRGCTSLTSITIPGKVTSIGKSSFKNCGKLSSIVIPSSVKTIDEEAFVGCSKLKDVFYIGSKSDADKINVLKEATWYYVKFPAPKTTTANEIGGIKVTWNNIVGATKYVVFRRQAGSSSWVNIGTTTSTTLLDKNVKSGTYYCYSVRAYNSMGEYSTYIPAYTSTRKFMATPKLTGISNATNGLYIKWNAVAGITNGYRVYRRGAGQTTWTYLGTTKNLYFTDSKVKNNNGEYFRYTVIADGGYHSKFDTTGLYLKRLSNPSLKSATFESDGVVVKWGSVKGSTGYYVYRKTSNSNWERIAIIGGANTTSYIDRSARKGITYTYTVRACSGSTLSYFYSGISCYDKY